MYLGAGSAPMLQAAAAWEALSDELATAARGFSTATSGLTGQAWQGAASEAMAAAAAPYAGFLSVASAQAAAAAGQANAVVSAFEAARAAIVHPLEVAANRNAFLQLVKTNWLGFNGPAIAAIEGLYEGMWARDVAAMFSYHAGAAAAAGQLGPDQSVLEDVLGMLPNIGIGNKGGTGNLGNGNTGAANVGIGNTGNGNVGGGNLGNNNIGNGNFGNGNFGGGNAASATSGWETVVRLWASPRPPVTTTSGWGTPATTTSGSETPVAETRVRAIPATTTSGSD